MAGMLRLRLIPTGLCVACLSLASAQALGAGDGLRKLVPPASQPAKSLRDELRRSSSNPRISAAEAARQVQRQYGGRVLSVQQEDAGYRVKVLKDGEVRIYMVGP